MEGIYIVIGRIDILSLFLLVMSLNFLWVAARRFSTLEF